MKYAGVYACGAYVCAMALGFSALSLSASAHHSAAMFDTSKKLELKGTVKDFQWTNPHSFLHALVANKAGKLELWSIEMSSPVILSRVGWKPKTLKPGDQISMIVHPRRDGTRGGDLEEVTLADGTKRKVGRGGVSTGY